MLVALGVGTLASFAFWYTREPRFYAETTVVIDRQHVSEKVVEPTLQTDALERIGAMAAQVLSRGKLAALVEAHGL